MRNDRFMVVDLYVNIILCKNKLLEEIKDCVLYLYSNSCKAKIRGKFRFSTSSLKIYAEAF